jgi:hypothetical protein
MAKDPIFEKDAGKKTGPPEKGWAERGRQGDIG